MRLETDDCEIVCSLPHQIHFSCTEEICQTKLYLCHLALNTSLVNISTLEHICRNSAPEWFYGISKRKYYVAVNETSFSGEDG